MRYPAPMCMSCIHLKDGLSCDAFERIPDPILRSQVDHRQPYEGDGGVRFEPAAEVRHDKNGNPINEDDHYYGAWVGGKKEDGGHPATAAPKAEKLSNGNKEEPGRVYFYDENGNASHSSELPDGVVKVDLGDGMIRYRQRSGMLTRWADFRHLTYDWRRLHPDTVVALNPAQRVDDAMVAMDQLDMLMDTWPGVQVSMLEGTEGPPLDGKASWAASCKNLGGGASLIRLYGHKWGGDYDLYSKDDSGWNAPGTGTPRGLLTHEFGHAVENALRARKSLLQAAQDRAYKVWQQLWRSGTAEQAEAAHAVYEGLASRITAIWQPILLAEVHFNSGYARTDKRTGTESFAEWFAQEYTDDPTSGLSRRTPYQRKWGGQFRSALEAAMAAAFADIPEIEMPKESAA